ncbi:MAG: NADH-ubiquinone oxidoreductase-F iron-sulfur binding region domain-containing protein, partial [Butyricicoccus pullicaecorum]
MGESAEGDLFGESYACAPGAPLTVSVIAAEDCEVLFINIAQALTMCTHVCAFHVRLVNNLMHILAGKNLMLSRKIDHLSRRTTREKLLAYLSDQAEAQGSSSFDIPFNRQELADFLSVDRSALSRVLSCMKREGLLISSAVILHCSPTDQSPDCAGVLFITTRIERKYFRQRGNLWLMRMYIETPSRARTVVEGLYRDVERRIAASPPGLCPVDMALSFLRLCHAQTCGKCSPCRIGLGQLTRLVESVLDGEANLETINLIEKTARVIADSSDCAIGAEAAEMVLRGVQGFREDYVEHVVNHRCITGLTQPVPCVSLCPAGVDIPGYIALINEKRYADAVRLIRKDNPFPSTCAFVCEHPCEARCRRSMVDAPINICGLKRYAVEHAGVVPAPACAPSTGKRIAVIGGGPGGLSAAYFLSLMGHQVVVYDRLEKLGGMLRYGIPDYRLPQAVLDADIDCILSTGVEVHTGVSIGEDISFERLEDEFDAIYLSIGAQTDKKIGIPGEDSKGVLSAVELLRATGSGKAPDFTGKHVV